jgi:hypothetical protein
LKAIEYNIRTHIPALKTMVATTSPQTPAENPLSEILIEKISQLSPSQQQ